MPGVEQIDYLTNSSMMGVDFLPKHLVIVGGSYIGLEFAQIYRRFGSQVTVVEKGPRLIQREDEDVSAETSDEEYDDSADTCDQEDDDFAEAFDEEDHVSAETFDPEEAVSADTADQADDVSAETSEA